MNKVVLLGRLTRDPEVRYTANQKVVATLTLAVDRPFTSGVKEADFIPVVVWGKAAELVGNSCVKGHRLLVEGRIQIRNYDGKDGQKHWITEVISERVEFIEKKETGSMGRPPHATQGPQTMAEMGKETPFDESVPF